MKKALIIIDMQNGLVNLKPWKITEVIENISMIAQNCRSERIEVIYVSHTINDHELFSPNTHNWEIISELKPHKGDKLFKKNFSSSFRNTGLELYLKEKEIEQLILTGMQTEKCLDTAVRVAFELGFDVIVPELTNTTFDNQFITADKIYNHHNIDIFDNRFARVLSMKSLISHIKGENNEV